MGGTSRFSLIFFFSLLTDCPSALVGATEPSLPRHLGQRQATKLKCHFNFLQVLVTAGPALSPGYGCKFHIMWCQKGYSPSITHSDLTHLSPSSINPAVTVGEGPQPLHERRQRQKETSRYKDFISPALSCLIVLPWDC